MYSTTAQIDPLQADLEAHELFHTVQWTYVPGTCPLGGQLCTYGTQSDLRWWMEATAEWAQPKVYGQDGMYPRDLDLLLSKPYLSMVSRGYFDGGRSYSSFIFADYLEKKVALPGNPATAPDIIRKTWEEYNLHSSDGMVKAIDNVLKRADYGTNLADEFPKFTWNNYFMISGTYDSSLPRVYTNLESPTNPIYQFDGLSEWQLFRGWLQYPRNDWNGNNPLSNGIPNAGVSVNRPVQYPWTGPSSNYSSWVSNLGAGYFEFLGGAPIAQGSTLVVTLESNLSPEQANQYSRISVLPIRDFLNGAKPQNQFLTPSMGTQGPSSSYYSFRVANFDQCSRVTVIANNVGNTNLYLYRVTAEVLPPAPGTPVPPCSLQLQ